MTAELCSALDRQPRVDLWPLQLSIGDGGFYASVQFHYGYNHIHRSVLANAEQERLFRYFLRGKKIKCAIETGTYKGTTTALLAHYADKVITIDTKNYIDKYAFWLEYGVHDKIESYIVDNDEDKAELLSKMDFDFAFLDGNHSVKGVRSDFALVKKCERVLFHDYYEEGTKYDGGSAKWQGVVPLVDSLPSTETQIGRPFAYWEKR